MIIRPRPEPEIMISDLPDENGMYRVVSGAGLSLARLVGDCVEHSLEGLEFAAGIPGTVGGAVTMNAGAYGGEIKDRIISADVMDRAGKLRTLSKEDLKLEYRSSIIQKGQYIVLNAVFGLNRGDADKSRALIAQLSLKRREKQPLEYPSAGSTFKRPEGCFAGKLIEDAGLKGLTVGGAQVSEKHAGFIINRDNAVSADIFALICEVQRLVYEHSGVRLAPEVKLLGFH